MSRTHFTHVMPEEASDIEAITMGLDGGEDE